MQNNYSVTSLNSYFKKQPDVNEEQLKEIINSFSSPVNPDVERFLHRNSIMFTKKKQSISYMVSQNGHLVGYFALAIKPVTFRRTSSVAPSSSLNARTTRSFWTSMNSTDSGRFHREQWKIQIPKPRSLINYTDGGDPTNGEL